MSIKSRQLKALRLRKPVVIPRELLRQLQAEHARIFARAEPVAEVRGRTQHVVYLDDANFRVLQEV